jgi:hypothetical protein
MTPFALFFMTISMACVTSLTAYCLYRILTGKPPAADDAEE